MAASLSESSISRISPALIAGMNSLPQNPVIVLRLPPIRRPLAWPGWTVSQRLGRASLAPAWVSQSRNWSVQIGGAA